ncbi:hypothetical protein HDV03_003403 [Kappamyces sp. JEL0829]|nr:hypothetical protein HDV03_003403 [Kappamyces sp. JEL0829]
MSDASNDIEDLPDSRCYPCVPLYGAKTMRNLEPGRVYRYCTCGLSKDQPWCNQDCDGTPFTALEWKCPEKPQSLYTFCGCKYSKSLPLCDTEHIYLPLKVKKRQEACRVDHTTVIKICSKCGWVPLNTT